MKNSIVRAFLAILLLSFAQKSLAFQSSKGFFIGLGVGVRLTPTDMHRGVYFNLEVLATHLSSSRTDETRLMSLGVGYKF